MLVGLCSGAYVAFHLGATDPRVVAEVLINPQTFEWREGDSLDVVARTFRSSRAYKGLLLEPRTWKRALQGHINVREIARALVRLSVARVTRMTSGFLESRAGQTLNVKRVLKTKLRRGARLLCVVAENDGALDNIELHLGHRARTMRGSPGFSLEIIPGVDHTFSQRWAKNKLAALVIGHVTRNFP